MCDRCKVNEATISLVLHYIGAMEIRWLICEECSAEIIDFMEISTKP
jgi:protein-arginine kinase activator protein McsA